MSEILGKTFEQNQDLHELSNLNPYVKRMNKVSLNALLEYSIPSRPAVGQLLIGIWGGLSSSPLSEEYSSSEGSTSIKYSGGAEGGGWCCTTCG